MYIKKNNLNITYQLFCEDESCNESIRLYVADDLAYFGWGKDVSNEKTWILCSKHVAFNLNPTAHKL